MAWVPDQQRREARPTAVLLVLAAMFLLPMGACGTVGAWKLQTALSPIVPLSSAGQLEPGAGLRSGTYVAVDVEMQRDELQGSYATDVDWVSRRIAGAPHVFLATRARGGAEGAHIVGQLCDADSPLMCEIPSSSTRERMRAMARTEHEPTLMLVSGAVPSDALWESAVGLGLAAACLLTFVFAAASLLRATREPGRVALTRTLNLTGSPDEIRAALRSSASPLSRIAEDSGARICVLLGMPVAKALLAGFHETANTPLRVDVEFQDAVPYRGTTAKLTVRHLLHAPADVAVERAAAWVVAATA